MYFWNGIKQRWQKVGCVAFSQNDNKRLILGSLKRRRQRKLQNNSNRFRPRQHVFVFVWKTEKSEEVYHLQEEESRKKFTIYSCTWENRSVHGLGKWVSSWNRVYHLHKSVPFTKKRPRRPETGIKDGLERMKSWKICNFVPEASKSCLSVGYWNETGISVTLAHVNFNLVNKIETR